MTRTNKIALRLLAGGLIGALLGPGLAHLVMYFDLSIGGVSLSPGGVVLAAVGGLYALMGLFVWVGVIWPALGTLILNVADEEDLRDRRSMLHGSAITCIALGLALIMLPFSGDGGPVRPGVALAALADALAITCGISWIAIKRKHYDELWRQLSADASAITLAMLASLMVVWGALAHVGWGPELDPLLVVAAPPGLFLLASFIAAGRRGLLLEG
jgi:hypothetical protein